MTPPRRSWGELAAILWSRRDRSPGLPAFGALAHGGTTGSGGADSDVTDLAATDPAFLEAWPGAFAPRDTDDLDLDELALDRDAGDPPAARSAVADDLLLCRRMRALRLDPDELYCSEPRAFGVLRRRCAGCTVPGRCARDLADEFADPAWQDWRNYCPNATTLSILSALRACGPDAPDPAAG
ncbi:hypothetical protein PQJ75_18870 [Rhodoplanes sp. TEM]|uniref:Uncharacterized protein n=1 Tax=Rhodoplanes tepidamans TaxID=200616 RepID=A0ABT5JJ32_RHOTP|nr:MULTISPECIES: hypothetical protein [Rhodoplanes]MDC7789733.1 hypothetical protein [Rhodoplanes tepidamans]MDC7985800.1 hypothetical protein [Rhodoplanes sp. TEM]MDQ0358874.1 hypothetical protein [Rhodoplanes tepidamans]